MDSQQRFFQTKINYVNLDKKIMNVLSKYILLKMVFLLIITNATAQIKYVSFRGTVKDEISSEPLEGATVACYREADSVIIKVTRTDNAGHFYLDSLYHGVFIQIRYVGYSNEIFNIPKSPFVNTINKIILLKRTGLMLSEVNITGDVSPITAIGDTIKFNTSSYRFNNSEMLTKLLNKLPGFQISNDGTLMFNGSPIKKILINGHLYFGDKINIALENISADLIKSVDLIEKVSDDAFITGKIHNKEKILNLEIKQEHNSKISGILHGGIGSSSRFATSISLNRFGKRSNWSLISSGNNMNKNLDGAGISDRLLRTWNAGINYSGSLTEYISLSVSYKFDNAKSILEQQLNRKNFLADTTYYLYNQNQKKSDLGSTHIITTDLIYKIDTLSKISWNNTISIEKAKSDLINQLFTLNPDFSIINGGNIKNNNAKESININGSLIASKNIQKTKGIISFEQAYTLGKNQLQEYNKTNNTFVDSVNKSHEFDTNQHSETHEKSTRLRWTASYNQTISKKNSLFFNLGYIFERYPADKSTFDFDTITKSFSIYNDSLTRVVYNNANSIYSNINFIGSFKKLEYSVGARYIDVTMRSIQSSAKNSPIFKANVVMPTAFLKYNLTTNKTLILIYDSKISLPIFTQINPLPDNTNPTIQRKGNPNLKISKGSDIYLSYTNYNWNSGRYISLAADATFYDNKIIDANWIEGGIQVTTPVNVDGVQSYSIDINGGLPIIKSNLIIDYTSNIRYQNNAFLINSTKEISRNIGLAQNVRIKYSIEKIINLVAGGTIQYNSVKYSNNKIPMRLISYSLNIDNDIHLPFSTVLGTSTYYTHLNQLNTGSYSLLANTYLLNDKLFKKKLTIKLQLYDIFNLNTGVRRNIGENYIEDSSIKTFGRTFLISIFIKL